MYWPRDDRDDTLQSVALDIRGRRRHIGAPPDITVPIVTDLKRAVAELKKGGSLTLASVPEGFDAFCVADLAHALAREAEKRSVVFVHGR